MNLLLVEKHEGEGTFPLFKKGTTVSNLHPCSEYAHWSSCVIDGYETYVPDVYVVDSCLIKNYNPSELVIEKEQMVTLIDIVFEWLYVKDENGGYGWLPASKVISSQHFPMFLHENL